MRGCRRTSGWPNKKGFGAKSTENLFKAIEARRKIGLDRFIYALGIRHVGETTARDLAKALGTFDAFRTAVARGGAGTARTARPIATSTTSRASARRWSMRWSISSASRTTWRRSTIC